MFAGADVVADGIAGGLMEGGHFHSADAFFAEQLPDGRGVGGAEEFALRVAPLIALGAGDVESTGSDQGEQQWESKGISSSRALYFLKLPSNQWGKRVFRSLVRSP